MQGSAFEGINRLLLGIKFTLEQCRTLVDSHHAYSLVLSSYEVLLGAE